MANPLTMLSLPRLRERTSAKWQQYGPDVLPLWVAEMDVALAEPVARALMRAIAIGDTGYPHGEHYGVALAEFAAARWDWTFEVEATATVADVMSGVGALLDLLTDRGDAVVINSPVYPPFYSRVKEYGRRVIEAPLNQHHRIDMPALEDAFAQAAFGGGRAAYLLCSPHNPTGTVHTRAELSAVLELAARHRVRVVADEIHAPIVFPGSTHVPLLSLPAGDSAFALLSASKAWNLAGVKAAIVVAGPGAAQELAGAPSAIRHGASHLGVIAHVAALRDGADWLAELLDGLDANRRLLGDLLRTHLPAVRHRAPQGTYLAWLDCRALGLGEDPAAHFLAHARVALSPGPDFGGGGAGHVRLNFATSPEILTEAITRMATAVGG